MMDLRRRADAFADAAGKKSSQFPVRAAGTEVLLRTENWEPRTDFGMRGAGLYFRDGKYE
jgi:hypothetical protein